MADLAGKSLCIGIEDAVFQPLMVDATTSLDPLHQTLLVDVFGRPCTVTYRHEWVQVINGLAVAEATGWIAF